MNLIFTFLSLLNVHIQGLFLLQPRYLSRRLFVGIFRESVLVCQWRCFFLIYSGKVGLSASRIFVNGQTDNAQKNNSTDFFINMYLQYINMVVYYLPLVSPFSKPYIFMFLRRLLINLSTPNI